MDSLHEECANLNRMNQSKSNRGGLGEKETCQGTCSRSEKLPLTRPLQLTGVPDWRPTRASIRIVSGPEQVIPVDDQVGTRPDRRTMACPHVLLLNPHSPCNKLISNNLRKISFDEALG